MDGLWNIDLSELTPESVNTAVALAMAVGMVYCFIGYRAFKLVLGLTGFVLAGAVAGTAAGLLSNGKVMYMAIAGGLGGLCGTFALLFLYKAGVFSLGALGALLIAYSCLADRPENWAPFAILGAGVLGGLGALFIERPAMTLVTAAIGAWVVVHGVAFLVSDADGAASLPEVFGAVNGPWIALGGWVALTLVGAAFQLSRSRPREKKAG